MLHLSCDGMALKESKKVPQQHHWVTDGMRFLSGKDFINAMKLRINALPTRSRTTRGRRRDRLCRAGCNEVETLNHVLQRCHRTHAAQVKRHDAIVYYIKRALESQKICDKIEQEPHFSSAEWLRKPDLVVKQEKIALVIDAQVVSEQTNLTDAHERKSAYYKNLLQMMKERYNVNTVTFTSATLSCRGIWSHASAKSLIDLRVVKKKDLKILSTRTVIGGLNAFWKFYKATMQKRTTGIG